jgi:hypothetical protein
MPEAVPSPRGNPLWSNIRRGATIAAASLLACGFKCGGTPDPGPSPPQTVAEVVIDPSQLSVVKGVPFRVSVRLYDANGLQLPDSRAQEVAWSASSGHLHLTPPARGASVVVTADPGTSPLPLSENLIASLSGRTARATVAVVAYATDAQADWMIANHASGSAPLVALIDGNTTNWVNDTTIAIVGEGPLADFKAFCNGANCGEVALFSGSYSASRAQQTWTNAYEVIQPVLTAPNQIPFKVWIATAGDAAVTSAAADVAFASKALFEGRTGLTIAGTPAPVWPMTIVIDVDESNDWKCATTGDNAIRKQLVERAGVPDSEIKQDVITVVYVTGIDHTTADGTYAPAPYRGYTCTWDHQDGVIILISWSARSHTTLAHELGHAFGPWGPPAFGHTNRADGFNETNLMWPWQTDNIAVSRRALTLGQTYRLAHASGSVLHRISEASPSSGVVCQESSMTEDPCPKLSKDFNR